MAKIMSDVELFRIKPIIWEGKDTSGRVAACNSVARFVVYDDIYNVALGFAEIAGRCDSVDDGKAKAEAWYREKLMAVLEFVGTASTHGSLKTLREP